MRHQSSQGWRRCKITASLPQVVHNAAKRIFGESGSGTWGKVKDCHCFALQPLTDVDQLCQSLHHCKYGTALFSSLKLNQPAFKTACEPLWSEASSYQVASFLCVRARACGNGDQRALLIDRRGVTEIVSYLLLLIPITSNRNLGI
ncbi:uncharacterized protein LOC121109778 [Gallus gallus]|uniref:uncharacterized protein LOC121109778 n=1 Tax=Gallus gallus TaxID=9031 RepID=UPI001F027F4D|nr:uncharacterized protein LOC121109778 [Gallus gallus]XP_046793201.1 uncharacterized protein LOC121109778 [Gallus gallus]